MSLIDKARESEINSYLKLEEDYQSLVDHAQALERQLEEARELIGNVLNITYDSEGVAGYHANGDIALWSEFEEIQMCEEKLKEQG